MYFIPSLVKSDFLALNILAPPACTEFTAFHALDTVDWRVYSTLMRDTGLDGDDSPSQ